MDRSESRVHHLKSFERAMADRLAPYYRIPDRSTRRDPRSVSLAIISSYLLAALTHSTDSYPSEA